MKNHLYSFLTFVIVALANISNANAQQVNAKIQEVFGDKTQELVANDSERLKFYNDIIENRVTIVESSLNDNEKYPKLSSVDLLNKYNASLTRDLVFDPQNFNPLKYGFIFSSKTPVVYRVDNTNYLIVIQPQTLK